MPSSFGFWPGWRWKTYPREINDRVPVYKRERGRHLWIVVERGPLTILQRNRSSDAVRLSIIRSMWHALTHLTRPAIVCPPQCEPPRARQISLRLLYMDGIGTHFLDLRRQLPKGVLRLAFLISQWFGRQGGSQYLLNRRLRVRKRL